MSPYILPWIYHKWIEIPWYKSHSWGKTNLLSYQLGTGLHTLQIHHPYPISMDRKKNVTYCTTQSRRVSQITRKGDGDYYHLHFAEKNTKVLHNKKANFKLILFNSKLCDLKYCVYQDVVFTGRKVKWTITLGSKGFNFKKFILSFLFRFVFETVSCILGRSWTYYVTEDDLELNSCSPCLHLPIARITDVHYR